jgi:mannose-6-phosphate isomerase-like protein (cupin superfamily)
MNTARVITQQALAGILRTAEGTNAERDLMEGPPTRVALLHESDRPPTTAEIHEYADDVLHVLRGSAVVTLGGTLESPAEVAPGEWRGAGICGGSETEVNAGDIVLIPRGVAHARHTSGRQATLLLVKVTGGMRDIESFG